MTTTAPLLYHGRPMDLRPIGRDGGDEVIRTRLGAGIAVAVTLEPGDATRYTLILAPVGATVWVIRTETSGHPNSAAIGAVCIYRGSRVDAFDVHALTRGIEWTGIVLAAFLNTVVGSAA